MKLLLVFVATSAALVYGQTAKPIPGAMAGLLFLQGEWHCDGGWVDFRFNDNNTQMNVRVRPERGVENWRKMMTIYLEDGKVRADLPDARGNVTHYALTEPGRKILVFVEDATPGRPGRQIVYKGSPNPDEVFYQFRNGDKVTESGYLKGRAVVRPLSE